MSFADPHAMHPVRLPSGESHQGTVFLKPALDWETYFLANGVEAPTQLGTHFSQADHAVDAALAGGGAVLGRISLTEAHLKEGRLVMPFAHALDAHASYRIVCLESARSRSQVTRFMDWVLSETQNIAELAEGLEIVERA